MTTGDLLVARVAMKPLATLNRPVLQDGRRRDQGRDGVVQGAHRRHRGARGRAWSRRRWSRSCSRPRRCASSAATRSPSSCATTTRTSRRCDEPDDVTARAPRARRADGRGQDDGRAALRRAARPRRSSTPTTWSSPPPAMPFAEIFGDRRRAGLPRRSSAPRSPTSCASPEPLVIACGGGAVLDPRTGGAARRRASSCGCRRRRRCSARASATATTAPAARRRRPRRDARAARRAARAGATRPPPHVRSTPRAARSTRSPRPCVEEYARGTGDRRARRARPTTWSSATGALARAPRACSAVGAGSRS